MRLDISNITAKMTKAFSMTALRVKKHSPEIMVILGVTGLVGSGVMACFATTKAPEIIEDAKNEIEEIHKTEEKATSSEELEAIKTENTKAIAAVYVKTGVRFVKLYGPSVALATVSAASILTSHKIMKNRNLAISAAYAAVAKDFESYQDRVRDRFGETVERELKLGTHKETIEETVTDPETGKTETVQKEVEVKTPGVYSEYARCFDESSRAWEKDAEMNLNFLRCEQNWANEKLRARGYMFLNEILERLDIPVTKAGQVVGWVYDPENGKGDNYIDFGIYDLYNPERRRFVNGYERSIWLDFNVDGNIYDLIPSFNKKK